MTRQMTPPGPCSLNTDRAAKPTEEIAMPKDAAAMRTAEATTDRRAPRHGARMTFVHLFIIALEVGLLFVQYNRMEALAFDLLPDLADIDLGFFYGSHLMGVLWVMIVILVSWISWEATICLHERGAAASGALRATVVGFWLMNAAVMVFEFLLFRMLVHDFSSLGVAGAAELFGLIMVAVHQACSFWIMKHVVKHVFFRSRDAAEADRRADTVDPTL